jgi:hypothetical protein
VIDEAYQKAGEPVSQISKSGLCTALLLKETDCKAMTRDQLVTQLAQNGEATTGLTGCLKGALISRLEDLIAGTTGSAIEV